MTPPTSPTPAERRLRRTVRKMLLTVLPRDLALRSVMVFLRWRCRRPSR